MYIYIYTILKKKIVCHIVITKIISYRDAGVIAIGHFVWSILSVLFVFSLLGVAHEKQSINMDNIRNSDHAVSITGKGYWLVGKTYLN